MKVNLIDKLGKLYYIGGVVRDEILGKPSFDIDLTYEGNAIEYAKNINGLNILKINEPFGTVRVLIDNQEIDIASTRAEIYERAGHLPTVTKIGCSLKDDVLRRDFTINALAKNFNTGEIVDYTGGLEDIKNGIIRVLHEKSFIDDPTRILRALKFAIRFNFRLDENTEKLRDKYLENINYDMSFKRIKKELIETFNLNSQKAYDEFIDKKIYKLVINKTVNKPPINIEDFVSKYSGRIEKDFIWLIYIGTLENLSNLELTKEEKKILNDYLSIKKVEPDDDYAVFKMFEGMRLETVILYGILKNKNIAELYLDNLSKIKITITGKDLQNMNIKPSKKYKECFDNIIKKKIINPDITHEEELNLAKRYFFN